MTARLDYRWHLRKVMADRGMFSTTDLIGPLAQREITLSSSQVYRLVTERPERLSLKILMALLDILDCAMDDLIEPVAAASPAAAGRPRPAGPGTPRASAPCDRSGLGSPAPRGDRLPPGDPVGALLALMAELEPGLSPEAVLGALEQAAARPDGRCRVAAAVTGQPGLLTGEGARAPSPASCGSSARSPARAPPR